MFHIISSHLFCYLTPKGNEPNDNFYVVDFKLVFFNPEMRALKVLDEYYKWIIPCFSFVIQRQNEAYSSGNFCNMRRAETN